MPGIPRTRPPVIEDVVVKRAVITAAGVKVFCEYRNQTTGEVITDDTDASARLFTWAEVATELSQVQADKLRRLPYKLLGATNVEADNAIAAEG